MQAGRDIVINATKVETANTPAAKAPIQNMINSPGGIQAGGNVTITSDRRVINSMMLRVTVEAETRECPTFR